MGMPVSKHINVKDPSIIRTNTERGSQVIRSPQLNGQSTFDSTYKEGDDVEDTGKSFKSISCNQGDTRDHITQNTDVNNMNTKFNILSYGTHHYSSFKLSNDVKADNSPVLACAFSDRTTRITSVNYNPHVVVKDAHIQDVHDTDNRDNAIKKGIDHIYEEGAEQTERSVEPDMCSQEETSFNNEQLHTFIVSSELHSETKLQTKEKFDNIDPENFLKVPELSFNTFDEGQQVDSLDDGDIDPFEGLPIPRTRTRSFGQSSVYSVKEISDDLYRKYKEDMKHLLRGHGFFETFPDPMTIREAQQLYRSLDLPIPVDQEEKILPYPPKVTKTEYLASGENEPSIDLNIVHCIPESVHNGSLSDVVDYLCHGLDDDLDSLQMIAAWLVHRQLKSENVDTSRRYDRELCCQTMHKMCKLARLKSKVIPGEIRGPDYIPGSKEEPRGEWLAVLSNYTWILLDPYIDAPASKSSQKTSSSHDEKDFLSCVHDMFKEPERFIFTHLPDDEHWQLLARQVSREEYAGLPVVREAFFDLHLRLKSCYKSMIYNTNPEFCMSLIYPGGSYLKFKCELQADDNSITAKRLRMYHFLENVLSTNSVNIRLRFPSKGHFVLNVFAMEENNGWRNVLTTRIINEAEDTQEAYPENPRDEWGPGVDAMKMGFVPKSHHSGEICVQTGVIQIVFRCETSIHLSHSLLRCDTRIDRNSFKVSVLRDKNNDVILIVDIDTKSQGIFILQLLARESKNEQILNICNYLIRKEKPQCVPKLEFVTNNKISEKTNITAPESGCLQMTVEAHGMVEMVVELKLQDIQELNFSEHSRHWIRDNRCFIDLNFPRRGTYTLLVRGKELYDGRMRHIQQETIIVDVPSKRWSCFPKVGVHWNSFHRIDSPLTHNLKEKEDVTFLVEVFYAQDVAVLAANGWYHLDRLGESWLWKGQVWTGPKSTRSQLLARFEVGSPKWSELLLFKILAEHDFERLEERQENARALASNIKKLSNLL